jgi:hypothetical protein
MWWTTDDPSVNFRLVATPALAVPTLNNRTLRLSTAHAKTLTSDLKFDSIVTLIVFIYLNYLLLYISIMKNVKQFAFALRAATALFVVICLFFTSLVSAAPYGKGKYGDDLPYGGETSLAISTGGDVSIQVTPTEAGTLATATNDVTVTSTDVVGYKLYIRSLTSTNMVNGASTISASGNGTPAALATNTWGYNTDGSSNFVGSTLSDTLIKNATGPHGSGDTTTVTYGVMVDNNKAAGNYVTSVVYTAAPQTE